LPKPIEFKNHAMSAARYGIVTHCKREVGYAGWSKEDWR